MNYDRLPAHMQGDARAYVERGFPQGGFLTAVLSNDLVGAFSSADSVNAWAMQDWATWLYNDAPEQCHGSPEKVQAWIGRGGLQGNGAEAQKPKVLTEDDDTGEYPLSRAD
jgi:hypothetical protein